MCRTRRRSRSSDSRASAASRSRAMSRSEAEPEFGGGLLAGSPALGVLAVGQRVVRAGVDHQDLQPGGGRVERDVLDGVRADVEEQHVAGTAGGRGHLVHQPARHPDEVVLGVLGDPGDLHQDRGRCRTGWRRPARWRIPPPPTTTGRRRPGPQSPARGRRRRPRGPRLAAPRRHRTGTRPSRRGRPLVPAAARAGPPRAIGAAPRPPAPAVSVAGRQRPSRGRRSRTAGPDRCCSRCVRRSG